MLARVWCSRHEAHLVLPLLILARTRGETHES